jgi:hypothetical protein
VDERDTTTIGASRRPVDERVLLAMTNEELDELFRNSPAGSMPRGDCRGTVLVFTGSWLAPVAAALCRAVVWQGKVFAAAGRQLVNKVSPFRILAVRAVVSPGPSWVDNRECVVIDYSRTSKVARWVRDEIRLVAPELYLGVVWLRRRRVAAFSLRVPAG